MTISAYGYHVKYAEYYIGIDPELIDKPATTTPPPNGNGNGNGKPPPPPPPPWELYITIGAVSAGSVAFIIIASKKDANNSHNK